MMSEIDKPARLALLVAADRVEWPLNLSVSTPAAPIIETSHPEIVDVTTGLCGATEPNNN